MLHINLIHFLFSFLPLRFELIASLLASGLVDFGTSRYSTGRDALVGECPHLYEHYTKRNVSGEIYLKVRCRPHIFFPFSLSILLVLMV